MRSRRVAVIGSGIQGICCALALTKQNKATVHLIEKQQSIFQRASLRNEGKIHLGFVYAKDESFRTPLRMLEDALKFSPTLDELCGRPLPWSSLVSNPFIYLSAKDSMVEPDRLMKHYTRLNSAYQEIMRSEGLHYLGRRPENIFAGAADEPRQPFAFTHAFRTEELAIDLPRLRDILVSKLSTEPRINILTECQVESVARAPSGFIVSGFRSGSPWTDSFDAVVNCSWDGRLRIDEQLGIRPPHAWVYRLKYRVLVNLPSVLRGIQSYTIVLGKYGDVVTYSGQSPTYLSWYPVCMQGWSQEIIPPREWEIACNGVLDDEALRQRVAQETLKGLDAIIPGIGRSDVLKVDAGIIYSRGNNDISDQGSELHERYDIGVQAYDGYFTINTGKFTSAPANAKALAALF